MSLDYDAIIIGTGQAGPPLAGRLSAAGMKTAVIERGAFGGTCVNTGCIPTKTLIASAYAAHMARRASDFGVMIPGPVATDMERVKARKDAVVGQSRSGVESWLRNMPNCTVMRGHARFRSAHRVQVGDATLEAPRIFINVGGRALVPAIPGLDQIDYLTNSSMMAIDALPRHLVIIGGSYIGLEFGQMYRRFGSAVTIVETAPRLIRHEDEDVSAAIAEILGAEGIALHLGVSQVRVAKQADGVTVRLEAAAGGAEITGSHLLLAVGRRPNTDDLGLETTGIAQDEHGYIMVDAQLQTSVPGVWALGDCNGKGAFTHTSYNDFEIVAANLLDHEDRRVSDRIDAYALFTDPPLGRAGMTVAAARLAGRRVLVGKRPMTRVGRAIEKGETQGFMKIAVDADSQEILGAAILGTGGDEVVHCILDVMYAKAPYSLLRRAMHIHPTVSELVPTLLGELQPA